MDGGMTKPHRSLGSISVDRGLCLRLVQALSRMVLDLEPRQSLALWPRADPVLKPPLSHRLLSLPLRWGLEPSVSKLFKLLQAWEHVPQCHVG